VHVTGVGFGITTEDVVVELAVTLPVAVTLFPLLEAVIVYPEPAGTLVNVACPLALVVAVAEIE